MRRWRRLLRPPGLVLAAGVLFTLWLQAGIPGPVFFNGDAGERYLLARQFLAGIRAVDLRLPAEPWVAQLWDSGLYPLAPPNVVLRDGRRYALFPYTLPLLSAPLLGAFGFRGAYLLPLVATWGLWLACLRAAPRLRLGRLATGLALFTLVFASPLTVYSALFWEHAPAVALAFLALLLVLLPRDRQGPSPGAALSGGLLLALAGLLREELYLACALLGAACGTAWLAGRPASLARPARFVLGGLALGGALACAVNLVGYGHPLGIHALAVLANPLWQNAGRLGPALRAQTLGLVEYFPSLLVAAALPLAVRGPRRDARPLALLGAALALAVGIPLLVRADGGRQWGPRFVFVCVPLLALCAGVALQRQLRAGGRARRALALLAFAAPAAYGCWLNSGQGARYVRETCARRFEAFALIDAAEERYVAVSRDSAALQHAALFGDRRFFLAERPGELRRLARALADSGVTSLLYLCHSGYRCEPFGEGRNRVRLWHAGSDRPLADFVFVARADRYLVYRARVYPR